MARKYTVTLTYEIETQAREFRPELARLVWYGVDGARDSAAGIVIREAKLSVEPVKRTA